MVTSDTRFSKPCVPAGKSADMMLGFILSNSEYETTEIIFSLNNPQARAHLDFAVPS